MSQPRHILLIDSNRSDLELAASQLRQCFPEARLELVATHGEFDAALQRGEFDLVLTEYWLDWDDGLTLFHQVHARYPDCPVIMLTGTGDEEIAVEAMLMGFDDYVLKARKGYERLYVRIAATMKKARLRREMRSAQKRAGDLLRIIEQSAVAVLITDHEGRIEYANPKFTEISGYTLDEVRGRNPRLLHSGNNPAELYRDMWQAITAGRDWHGTLQNRRKDGSLYWESDTIFAIKGEDGTITHYISIQEDITERVGYQERLSYQANHDELTGLPNRNFLQQRLEQILGESRRRGDSVALALLDLDNFKVVNDSLGHDAGNALLLAVATRLGACVRADDLVARIGGDEFALLLPHAGSRDEVAELAEKVRRKLAEPIVLQDKEVFSGCSIGVVIFPGDGEDSASLLKHADTAMFHAKACGRDNIQFYSAAMSVRNSQRLALESDLRHALARDQLVLYYQPILDLRTGFISGAEALIRWQHPVRGLVPPVEFIPLAEETGLIVPIGDWVIRTACAQMRAWQAAGFPELSVAVNVSARQFERHDVLQTVAAALHETGLDPASLKLELTESMLMQQPERSSEVLGQIRPSGVKLSLDDFGTGYSSLNYLKRFPFDYVKIDQSFIRHVTSDPHAAAITRTIITLAHDLGLHVIAEGVETLEQMVYLRDRFCDEMQGYYFSRPVPPEEFGKMLHEGRRLAAQDLGEKQRRTLLLVDDEQHILNALIRTFRREHYHILRCTSPLQAFDMLAANRVGVILSDQRMPDMSGVEFLRRVKQIYPDTIRIVLSGYTDLKAVTSAVNEGSVYKFLTKPWIDEQLRANVRDAFERYDMAQENLRLARAVSEAYEKMAGLKKG